MAVTADIDTEESEQDTTDSDSIKYSCQYCGHNYKQYHDGICEHLICKIESVESNNELIEAADHPVVATLFGMEVPRVVAGRFMHHIRNQLRNAQVHTNTRGVRTMDLMPNRGSTRNGGLTVLRYSCKSEGRFTERTFYVAPRPSEFVGSFISFVKKQYYCDHQEIVVPYSCIKICAEIMALDAVDLSPELYQMGTWVMVEGLPDGLPLFFFGVATPIPEQPVMLINYGTSLTTRMTNWNIEPTCVSLFQLSRLPSVAIN